MENTFTFVGKIKPIKKTDKFNPYSKTTFDSGWEIQRLSFNMICDTNRHILEIQSGKFTDDSKNTIYTLSKSYTDDNGVKHKCEPKQIPFIDRFNKDIIDSVASFKKFVVELDKPNHRNQLKNAIDNFKDGTITDEQMESLNCHSIEEVEKELKNSESKRHEFISEYDFLKCVNRILSDSNYEDKLFRVSGAVNYTYNPERDIFYQHLTPTKIYLVDDETEPQSIMNLQVFFNKDSLDTDSFENNGKYYLNGYLRQYAKDYVNHNISVPITLTIDGNGDEINLKKANLFKKRLTQFNEAEWKEIGLKCVAINGAERIEITEDDLTDEQKENIECGLTTFEAIKRDLGGTTFGDRICEIRVDSFAKGYTTGGAQDTVYIDEDFAKPQLDGLEDEDEDIFI